MDKTIAGLTEAFKEVNRGQGEVRTRAGFVKKRSCACVEWMPYMRKTDQSVTVKVVAYQPDNIQTIGIPTVLTTTSLYDFNNGHLVALCDAVTLTAIRTGVASAIASKILANPALLMHGYDLYFLVIAKLLNNNYFKLFNFYVHTLIQQRRKSCRFLQCQKNHSQASSTPFFLV